MFDTLSAALLAVLTLAAAVYAHLRLPALTPNHRQLWISRLLLILLGIGFGWAMVTVYRPVEGLLGGLVFLSAFGLVHVPAAAVLFIKQRARRA